MPPKKGVRVSAEKIQDAINEVIQQNMSMRSVAKAYNISKSHLGRLVKEAKKSSALQTNFIYCPKIGNRRIFSTEQENMLSDYLKISAKMCYGLTTVQVRELAYQYALKLNIAPEKWQENKTATVDWLKKFLKRNSTLTVRKPENTSLARTTGFNKVNVTNFFDNLQKCYQKYKFNPNMIWNVDETGCSTVTNTPKVVTESGVKRVGQISSAERGSLVTMLAFVNAAGGNIPPVFIFPRVHYKNHMLQNGPNGALGLANQSGWMTEDCFLKSLEHFVKQVKPTETEPAFIILDNHKTHITINIILFARHYHLIILTFPPHCSHRLQPLDITVFGPFKSSYKAAINDWMTSNPGQTVTIYNVAEFAKNAYYSAFNMRNITSGFKNTGIYPLNKNIFTEDDFLPSAVTDRPLTIELQSNSVPENSLTNQKIIEPNNFLHGPDGQQRQSVDVVTPSTSKAHIPGTSAVINPEVIRPFPKAPPRKNVQQYRKISTKIITSTPEKDKLLIESMTDLLSKENSTTTLIHVRDTFKNLLTEKDQKKGKNIVKKRDSNKKRKVNDTKKRTKGKPMKSSSSSSEVFISDLDSCEDCSDSSVGLRKRRKHSTQYSKDNTCCVCKQSFDTSKEDWFKCKICGKWANESCGIKGVFNFFCSLCH